MEPNQQKPQNNTPPQFDMSELKMPDTALGEPEVEPKSSLGKWILVIILFVILVSGGALTWAYATGFMHLHMNEFLGLEENHNDEADTTTTNTNSNSAPPPPSIEVPSGLNIIESIPEEDFSTSTDEDTATTSEEIILGDNTSTTTATTTENTIEDDTEI